MDQKDKKGDTTPSGRKRYDVTPERFIEVWQRAGSADEVATTLGMSKAIVHARASSYRGMGIKLKKMPRRPKNKVDVAALNRKIEELSRQQDDGPAE